MRQKGVSCKNQTLKQTDVTQTAALSPSWIYSLLAIENRCLESYSFTRINIIVLGRMIRPNELATVVRLPKRPS